MNARWAVLLGLLILSNVCFAQSQDGADGAQTGQAMLDAAAQGVKSSAMDANSGTRGAGTLTLDGEQVDANDLVPGADRGSVDAITNYKIPESGSDARASAAMRQSMSSNSAEGDAARILVNGNTMSPQELRAGGWLKGSEAIATGGTEAAVSALFADCTTQEVQSTPSAPIPSTQVEHYTCSTGQAGASCVRSRDLHITQGPATDTVADESLSTSSPQSVAFTATVDTSDPDRLPAFLLVAGPKVQGAALEQAPTAENGWAGIFSTGLVAAECAAGGCSAADVRVQVVMRVPGPIEVEDDITRGSCEDEADANGCQAQWTCLDNSPRTIDGIRVDRAFAQRHNLPALAPGLPDGGLCWAAGATLECPICLDGDRGCRMGRVSSPEANTCQALEANPSCALEGRVCVIYGPDGQCTSWAQQYACSKEVVVQPLPETSTVNACQAQMPCMGDGCRSSTALAGDSQQGAMARAAAQLAVTNAVMEDFSKANEPGARSTRRPTSTTPTQSESESQGQAWGYDTTDEPDRAPGQNVPMDVPAALRNVQIFKGNPLQCRKGWGGLVDCCGKTSTDAEQRYWRIYRQVADKLRAQQALARGGSAQGGWQSLSSGNATMADLNKPFTSNVENVTGGGSTAAYEGAMQDAHTLFMQEVRKEVKGKLSPKWVCNDPEFDLAVQREVGMCAYAGTYCDKKVLGVCLQRKEAYCCYSSPMSKLLRASVDGGKIPMGDAKDPDCRGIPLDRLDEIDWNAIPFDEITGRMSEGGALPSQQDQNDALERYTGSGVLVGGAGRPNAVDRNGARVEAVSDPSVRASLEADARTLMPTDLPDVAAGDALVNFSPAYLAVQAGRKSRVTLSRDGNRSAAVEATVQVVEGDPQLLGFYSETVRWGPQDIENKGVVLDVDPSAAGTTARLSITDIRGGKPGSSTELTLVIRSPGS